MTKQREKDQKIKIRYIIKDIQIQEKKTAQTPLKIKQNSRNQKEGEQRKSQPNKSR